jgi:SMC interacting uncharacterized protein involved in chromosome segregation
MNKETIELLQELNKALEEIAGVLKTMNETQNDIQEGIKEVLNLINK